MAGCSASEPGGDASSGQTAVTNQLNDALNADSGVFIRSVPDYNTSAMVVGSFTRNDIEPPTPGYPVASAFCGAGTPEYGNYSASGKPEGGPGGTAEVCDAPDRKKETGVPAGTDSYRMPAVGWAIEATEGNRTKYTANTFYFHDANALDGRCWYNAKTKECLATSGKILPDGTIDDAGGPGDHDGRGCHSLGGDGGAAPQILAAGPDGETLVQGKNCQCNVKLSGNDWNDWIDHWLKYAYPPDDSQSGDYSDQFTYFKGSKPDVTFDEEGGRNAKAQGTNVDWSACWTTTIDDMVALQNALWQRRGEWWNGQIPLQPEGHRNLTDVEGQPYYWGWNEVPFFSEVDFAENRDATNIMLPANFDSLDSLDDTAKKFLLSGIKSMVNDSDAKRALDISAEPDVVIMAQESVGGKSWKREFYCQDYTFDPNKPDLLQIKYDSSGDGRCYLTGTLRPDGS